MIFFGRRFESSFRRPFWSAVTCHRFVITRLVACPLEAYNDSRAPLPCERGRILRFIRFYERGQSRDRPFHFLRARLRARARNMGTKCAWFTLYQPTWFTLLHGSHSGTGTRTGTGTVNELMIIMRQSDTLDKSL